MYQGHPDQTLGCTTYSQHCEDVVILNIFRLLGTEKPSYLDLGAHHPVNISNTALLYERGCSGINVEANPNLIGEFKRLRPRDVNICIGIGPRSGRFLFHMYDEWSGLNSLLDCAHPKGWISKEIEIDVITIGEFVSGYCGGIFPELLCTDLEGLDYDVLAQADLSSHNGPRVVCSEVRQNETARFESMMAMKGFWPLIRMGENIIFVRPDDWHRLR